MLKLSKQLKENRINLETYTDCFEKVKKELVDTYKNWCYVKKKYKLNMNFL